MVRIIINADDLGYSHTVNCAIDELLTEKKISSSTILANSSTWEEIHTIVDKNKHASFGIHLNLTEGKALTSSPILMKYGIVDGNNCFTRNVQHQTFFPTELKQAIYREWKAQCDKVIITEGIPISHIDGHHHVHAIVGLEDILIKIAEKYNILKIRNRYLLPATNNSILKICFSKLVNIIAEAIHLPRQRYLQIRKKKRESHWAAAVGEHVKMTTYFSSYSSYHNYLKKGGVMDEGITIELMCHPGHPRYAQEQHEVADGAINRYMQSHIIINYIDL